MTQPLPTLISQMLQPSFYPHPVGRIELIQTHISFVILTGDYVYKIKKPVDFGFLDFSTLEKRKHFCHEELRLNKHNAPEIYLDVLPITQNNNTYRFATPADNEENITEYILKMKQFPQSALMSDMFEREELTEKHIEMLGITVVKLHDKAATSDYINQFGRIPVIKTSIDDNYAQSRHHLGITQTQKQLDETKRFTDTFFEDNKDIFSERVNKGKIRECHGDLHLRNIAYWHDKILVFDCIEFSESLRYVDLMYDVAFTVMDLQSRGSYDLANIFLNTYMEQSGDWEGLRVLPLYLIRQAYVRGKVNSLMLDDPAINDNEKKKIISSASHYYHLAWEYTRPHEGRIIMISGLSGSGKSTVAKLLAKNINGVYIRSDAVRKHIGGIKLHERGDESLYSPEMTCKTYDRMKELGVSLAKCGYIVILDAKYDKQKLRGDVIKAAQENDIELNILYCTTPVDILKERLKSRSGDITDATVNLLDHQMQEWEGFDDTEKPLVIEVDTAKGIDKQLQKIIYQYP